MFQKTHASLLAISCLCWSCSVFNTGSLEPYNKLKISVDAAKGTPQHPQAASCLAAATDLADRARSNRQVDMGMIAGAAFVGASGVGLTTASTFVSDTDHGEKNHTKQWLAGAGAISMGLSAAVLGLRTALNLGELSSEQTSSAATQATLTSKILHTTDEEKRDKLYFDCTQLMTSPNSAYPGAQTSPINGGQPSGSESKEDPPPAPATAPPAKQ